MLALVTCALVMIALMVELSVSLKEQNVPSEEPWAKLTTPTEKVRYISMSERKQFLNLCSLQSDTLNFLAPNYTLYSSHPLTQQTSPIRQTRPQALAIHPLPN